MNSLDSRGCFRLLAFTPNDFRLLATRTAWLDISTRFFHLLGFGRWVRSSAAALLFSPVAAARFLSISWAALFLQILSGIVNMRRWTPFDVPRVMKRLGVSVFVVFVFAFILSAQKVPGQEKQRPSQKSEMKPMGKMSMDDMMKECREHHQSAMKSIDQMTKMMEGARQSNNPAKMRTALDQGQKQLSEMKEHMAMCGNMMSMMEKMQGMGGIMKGESK